MSAKMRKNPQYLVETNAKILRFLRICDAISRKGICTGNPKFKSRLLPFLEKYHSDQDFFFWPDLATCHYAKDTQELYSSLQIPYIPRDSNPPNTPQLRPIEKFWAILKDKVYEGGWEATTFRMLKQRVLKSLKNLDPFLCQNLFRDLKTKIRKADDVGVMAVI